MNNGSSWGPGRGTPGLSFSANGYSRRVCARGVIAAKENRVSSFLRRSLAFGTWVLWYTPVGRTRRRTASVREMEEARELGS